MSAMPPKTSRRGALMGAKVAVRLEDKAVVAIANYELGFDGQERPRLKFKN
jgi:hypothetical protein